ncbi:MAG: hypothetical protein CM15mP98_10240 [Paracoccaceae bacterium]|nr:MAG: hypothetical protein CM15mP98_10240 [Paracoccaceae bacterium]
MVLRCLKIKRGFNYFYREISFCFAKDIIPKTIPKPSKRKKAVPERTNVADSPLIFTQTGRFKGRIAKNPFNNFVSQMKYFAIMVYQNLAELLKAFNVIGVA